MSFISRAGLFVALFAFAGGGLAGGATPKEIDAAIQKGSDYLKAKYTAGGNVPVIGAGDLANFGIGPTCLAGLALLEAGTPPTDAAVKVITERVRKESYSQTKTYQTSLSLMYLDRLGDPVDVPLIQMLAVRLLAGQTPQGGWSYQTCSAPSPGDIQRLAAMKPTQQAGKLHPEIELYAKAVLATRENVGSGGDDNSNTQFAVLAIWLARKHGVPVESALDRIEQRFLTSQIVQTGGWPYTGGTGPGVGAQSSPSMHCAGLIGIATAVARREERRNKAEQPKKEEPPKKDDLSGPAKKNPDDPFFNPPQKSAAGGADSKKPAGPARADFRDRSAQLGLSGLGAILAESAKVGRGALFLGSQGHGVHDYYFFWSLERVGVIYGVDKIGGVNWYEAGAATLVRIQQNNGSWTSAGNISFGSEVDTSFAVLFLCRSNLARDLSSKVQRDISTEMRAGGGPGGNSDRTTVPATGGDATAVVPNPVLAGPIGSEAATLAGELLRANEKEWPAVIKKLRESKGPVYTLALVATVNRLDGDKRQLAREALAERLTRMTAATLRTSAKDEDPELRRAAVLAMAMKDDKSHIADLVAAINDEEDFVIRAARAGLKSMTGQDFGPSVNATTGQKKLAVTAWNDWLSKQKK